METVNKTSKRPVGYPVMGLKIMYNVGSLLHPRFISGEIIMIYDTRFVINDHKGRGVNSLHSIDLKEKNDTSVCYLHRSYR